MDIGVLSSIHPEDNPDDILEAIDDMIVSETPE
jgi:hypothetical protein